MNFLAKIKDLDIEKMIKHIFKIKKKEDLTILFTVLITGFLNFYFFLGHTVLSPDGLVYGPLYKSGRWEFQLGRPLLAIVDRLRGGLVSPPMIVFFSLFYIALTIMTLRRIFPMKNNLPWIIISIFVVLFPTISDTALFIYCLDSYCLALLFSVLGIFFIKKKKYFISIISIIISLSLYQAYISVTITGILILYILDLLDNKDSLKNVIFNMLIIFISLVLYYCLLKIGMSFLGLNLPNYKGASSFGIKTIISLPNSIINAYKDYFNFFISDSILYNNYYHRNLINIGILIIFIITASTLFFNLDKKKKVFFLVANILLPITVNIMDLIACETRINTMLAIGFIMIYLYFIVIISNYCKVAINKTLGYILIIILSYTYLLSNNASFQVRVDIFNNYYTNSMIIINKVKNLEGYKNDLPWMFNNTIDYTSTMEPLSNDSFVNFFETFYGYLGVKENEYFYKRFLGEKIYVVEEDRYSEIIKTPEYKEMPTGSVKIIDGIIVIKVSDKDL